MKINIYYGGRGVLDDPSLYVINKMEQVLTELRVEVVRYNIYEEKNTISTLPQTLKDVDGVIFATTVEWLGIGGYMTQFLDACWLYGDKESIQSTYMQPVVMSTTYGEREGMTALENAWEILGGLPCSGLCGYVEDMVTFEMNQEFSHIIEKKAENLYRTISQKAKSLPASNQAVARTVLRPQKLDLTPQESEQLSQYVSDDGYVKQQKEDILELSNMFRGKLGQEIKEDKMEYVKNFKSHFRPQSDFQGTYLLRIEGKKDPMYIEIRGNDLQCEYLQMENAQVYIKITRETIEQIIQGRMTFQRAFSVGEMTAKGDFKMIRMLDELFAFTL